MSNRKRSKGARGCPAPGANSRRHVWLVYIGLAVAVLAVYGQVITFQFVSWGDWTIVSENPHVVGGLTWDNFVWSLGIHGPAQWHPLSWWIHQLVCELFGLEPGAHHVVSALLHVAAALALLTAFWRLSGDFWPSALVAALFALHPFAVESAAAVSHLRDPLSTLFWALVMWSYAVYARRGGFWRYGRVLLLFALGLMAKPMLVTLPCVLLLLDYWPLARVELGTSGQGGLGLIDGPTAAIQNRNPGWLLLEKAPLLVLSGVSTWLSYLCQQAAGEVVSLEAHPLGSRLGFAVQGYAFYLRNMLWPAKLSAIYPETRSSDPSLVAGAVVLLLALTAAAIYFGRRRRYWLVGWLWYLGTLVPVIGLLKMGGLMAMTDHHAYVPLLGIYVALAWTLATWVAQRPAVRPAVIGGVAAVLLGLLPITGRQVATWRDSESLYEHALAVTNDNMLAHYNLAVTLREQGRIVEAIEHYQRALRINPDYVNALVDLGGAVGRQGMLVEAARHLRRALTINPHHAEAHNDLGNALQAQGDVAAAVKHYQRALQINPNHASAHLNLGIALERKRKFGEALEHYHQALRIRPDFAAALNNLAWIRATSQDAALRDGTEAVELGERSCALTGGQRGAAPLDTLAAAYAEAGRFEEAILTASRAIDVATAASDERFAQEIRERTLLYMQGVPYREPGE